MNDDLESKFRTHFGVAKQVKYASYDISDKPMFSEDYRDCNGVVLLGHDRVALSHFSRIIDVKSGKPAPGGTNSNLRIEPTWGAPTKLNIVINSLDLDNKNTLASSFGASSYVSHLQIVRNAAAHRHHQKTAEVLALRPYYQVSRLRHPSEALLWLEEQTKSFAFLFWLEDMRMLGKLAVQ